ncbi:PREDICTED: PRAME family member 6-like [Mandrillus leucophaeus]|uniref:PRAME family member 6-like n=1 Tax=Mandrillus leucophaeus TaxID=9568 RepID=UPI0005F424E8|nr:PREDICTED: PRAME family member 6-like [Mandrillus leucophaeus]
MSVRTPPRLLELAGRSLLRDQALTMSTLEELPTELFPPMFLEAFSGRRCEALKLMVQAWPFRRLPLRPLIKMGCLETFQAVLDGLDALLTQGVRLSCKKLRILGMPFHNIRNILKMVNLDCIQEVEVNCSWILPILTQFTPYLGQMRNLQKLDLSHVDVSHYVSTKQKEFVTQFTSQFLKLHYLQKLYMNSVSFLEGHLDQLLSCLKTPLKILAITNCVLLESDLRHLSQCPSVSQLKTLDLRGIRLANLCLVPLQVLLGKVAATLEYLGLDDCGIVDSQVNTILPALSRCFELTTFSFCGNPISMATLENLLCHTIRLNNLCLELYPAPRDSYDAGGTLCWRRFAQLRAELMGRVRDLRHPKRILFCTDYCADCGNRTFYGLEVDQCCC